MTQHRRSIRLKEYDYAQTGAYFVTICTHQREPLFGEILKGVMGLNAVGCMVLDVWRGLSQRFSSVALDEFIVMPNHVHAIFWITDIRVGAPLVGALPRTGAPPRAVVPETDVVGIRTDGVGTRPTPTVTLGDIVGAMKSITTVEYIHRQRNVNPHQVIPKLWQRNYYERIIRTEEELHAIRHYIRNNPAQWELDEENVRR